MGAESVSTSLSRVVKSQRVSRVVKRESRVVNRWHEGNNVKRVSRVAKRVQSSLQAHVKKVSRGCLESGKWM